MVRSTTGIASEDGGVVKKKKRTSTTSRFKTQRTIMEKIFAMGKGLISLCKELLQINKKMAGRPTENSTEDMNIRFKEQEIQILFKPKKISSDSEKMQI